MSWIRGYSSLRIQLRILRIDLQSELDQCSALSLTGDVRGRVFWAVDIHCYGGGCLTTGEGGRRLG